MGTTAQKLEYLNTTKSYIKNSINLSGANITNEPFRNYANILKNRLPEILGDPSIIWNNYEHITGSGTSISISTYKSIFEYSLNGNTTQSGTPAPDAPVPVNTVTGNQTISISDGTNSTVQYINLGKNILPTNSYTFIKGSARTLTINFNEKIPAGTYTFSCKISSQSGLTTSLGLNGSIYNGSTSLGEIVNIKSNTTSPYTYTKTITEQADHIYLYLNSSLDDSATITLEEMQIEKGSTATSYAPYFEPIELCKIGDYKDRIYKSNGKWYLHKEIGKVVLNGSENWSLSNSGTSNFLYHLSSYNGVTMNTNNSKCNYFQIKTITNSTTDVGIYGSGTGGYLRIRTTSEMTLADFKTWLGTHNTIVYYPLDTATDKEIKNYDLLNDLNNLELMTGNITITVSGDLPSPIDITAIKN